MSQSHLLKFGIIPVILTIAAAVTVQRLTTANAENASQQNVPITKVFSNLTTENSAKSQTETAITQASEKISAAKNNSANQTPELSSAEISAEKNSSTSSTNPGEKLSASKSEISAVADNSGNNSKVELPQLKDAPASTTVKSPVASAESKPKSPSPSGSAEKTQSASDSQSSKAQRSEAQRATVAKDSQKPESAPVVVPYRELPPMPQPQTTPVVVPYRELPPMPQPQATSETNSDAIEKDWSENNLLFELFATPDAPGVLAIGTAEGTVTASGQLTSSYWGHTDPGNGANNLGTFSYQHGAPTPRQADWRQLRRLQGQVETILGQAQEQRVKLSALELVAGADLLNQAPAAGMSYVENLKKARDRGTQGINAVLEARVMSFINPETGVLEASGFGNNWEVLQQDQWRRLVELHQTLQLHGVI